MNVDLAFVKPLFIRSFIWSFIIILFLSVITGQGALAYTLEYEYNMTGGTSQVDFLTSGSQTGLHLWNFSNLASQGISHVEVTAPMIRKVAGGDGDNSGSFTDALLLSGTTSAGTLCALVDLTWETPDEDEEQLEVNWVYDLHDYQNLTDDDCKYEGQRFRIWQNEAETFPPYNYIKWFSATESDTAEKPFKSEAGTTAGVKGLYKLYSGSSCIPPTAAFAADNVYTNKDAVVTFTDLSTGDEPTSWLWDLDDVNYNTEIVEHTFEEWGDYNVSLYVENACGSDWENKTDYIHVQMFQNWTPTPTPTWTYPAWQNVTFFNMTEYREDIEDNELIGNMTTPILDLFDEVLLPIFNLFQLFSGFMTFPFTLVTQYIVIVTDIFDKVMPTFTNMMAVPLVITGKVVNMIPYQIQQVITLAIIFDIFLLLIRGD